jgi:hypothetical protein
MDIPLKKNYSHLLFWAPGQRAERLSIGFRPALSLNEPTRVRLSKRIWKNETAFFTAGWSLLSPL